MATKLQRCASSGVDRNARLRTALRGHTLYDSKVGLPLADVKAPPRSRSMCCFAASKGAAGTACGTTRAQKRHDAPRKPCMTNSIEFLAQPAYQNSPRASFPLRLNKKQWILTLSTSPYFAWVSLLGASSSGRWCICGRTSSGAAPARPYGQGRPKSTRYYAFLGIKPWISQ